MSYTCQSLNSLAPLVFPVKRYGISIPPSEFRCRKTRKSSPMILYSRLDNSTDTQQQQLNLSVLRFTLGRSKTPLFLSLNFNSYFSLYISISIYFHVIYAHYLCVKLCARVHVLDRNTWIGRIVFASVHRLRIWFSFGIESLSRFRFIRHHRCTARELAICIQLYT